LSGFKINPNPAWYTKEVEKEHNQDESSGIFNVSDLDYETLFKETTMKKYLGYWEQWRALER